MRRLIFPTMIALALASPGLAAAQPAPQQADPAHQPETVGVAPADVPADYTVAGATRQTMPSTISKENAGLDRLPIMAREFPLTTDQKKMIYGSISKAASTPGGDMKIGIAQELPFGTSFQEFPKDVTAQIPDAARFRYVKLTNRVLIVNPVNRVVIGDIQQ